MLNYNSEIPTNEFSIVRALGAMAQNKPIDGIEREVTEELSRRSRRGTGGLLIPLSRRDVLNASGTATLGGNTIQTDVLGGSFIDILMNESVCFRLGAQRLGGLVGDTAIPSGVTGSTAYWVGENDQTTPSNPTFGQVGLTPHRLTASTIVSKRLLIQASLSIESFLRNHLAQTVAVALDYAALAGAGADGQPAGILNTNNVGSVTFGGAATFEKLIEFETSVATANALTGSLAYVISPATKSKFKLKPVIGSTFPTFLWQTPANDRTRGLEGTVSGFRAIATPQLDAAGHKVIFGNWNDLIIADWGALEVTADPYTLADKHQMKITVNLLADVAVRHPGSFAVSSDSGAQ